MKITIDATQLTLGDLEDLEANKVSAIVSVLTKFSDLTRDEVRAIPLGELNAVGEDLTEAIKERQDKAVPFGTSES